MITPTELIDLLGGTAATAKLAGVQSPSVSEWRGKAAIPEASLIKLAPAIERASEGKITRQQLLPNDWHRIWPELTPTQPVQVV